MGSLDITLYRDDFAQVGSMPLIGTTEIPVDITDRRIVIVDDVLYTGRTVRAALNEIADFGRAGRVELCVLVDRGGRELPIQADYVGISYPVGPGQQIEVRVPEEDGELCVQIVDHGGVAH
jgi:pyrimidine operon attenuation protein/uracil phosphoribosyltransferase